MLTTLSYELDTRIWLLDNGYDVLQQFAHECCEIAYPLSCEIPPGSDETEYYHDVNSAIKFQLFETDLYPADGYESVFIEISDFIRRPELLPNHSFLRWIKIYGGGFAHNPEHGKNNVSQTQPPRMRKSAFFQKWGLTVKHQFRDGKPTNEFSYSLSASDVPMIQSPYGPNCTALLKHLNLTPVKKAHLNLMPRFKDLLKTYDINKLDCPWHYSQLLDYSTGQWRGYVDFNVSTGWFSSEKKRCLVE